nr:hypothetical protein [Leuven Tombus-like virus 3]
MILSFRTRGPFPDTPLVRQPFTATLFQVATQANVSMKIGGSSPYPFFILSQADLVAPMAVKALATSNLYPGQSTVRPDLSLASVMQIIQDIKISTDPVQGYQWPVFFITYNIPHYKYTGLINMRLVLVDNAIAGWVDPPEIPEVGVEFTGAIKTDEPIVSKLTFSKEKQQRYSVEILIPVRVVSNDAMVKVRFPLHYDAIRQYADVLYVLGIVTATFISEKSG